PSPRFDNKITGRRPNRSDRTPRTGEKKNCIRAKTVPKMPSHVAALVALPLRKFRMSFGKTGAINPRASMSSMTVMKIKTTAALRAFIGKIDNCRGGRVGRKIEMTQAARLPLQTRVNLRLDSDDSAFVSFAQNASA